MSVLFALKERYVAGELVSTTTTPTLTVSLGTTVQQGQAQQPNFLASLEHTPAELICLMLHSVTSVMKGSTVRVEKQHQEVPAHLGFTVHGVLEWLSSFLALMVLIILTLEGHGKTNVRTALRAISVKKGLCSLRHVP